MKIFTQSHRGMHISRAQKIKIINMKVFVISTFIKKDRSPFLRSKVQIHITKRFIQEPIILREGIH
jgi:hypothetical protein